MTQSDPVTSARDIHTLSEEYQPAGADLVEDLYWHLVDRNGRGVTMDEAREYNGRLTALFRRGADRPSLPAPRSAAMLRRSAASVGTERALAAKRALNAEDDL